MPRHPRAGIRALESELDAQSQQFGFSLSGKQAELDRSTAELAVSGLQGLRPEGRPLADMRSTAAAQAALAQRQRLEGQLKEAREQASDAEQQLAELHEYLGTLETRVKARAADDALCLCPSPQPGLTLACLRICRRPRLEWTSRTGGCRSWRQPWMPPNPSCSSRAVSWRRCRPRRRS